MAGEGEAGSAEVQPGEPGQVEEVSQVGEPKPAIKPTKAFDKPRLGVDKGEEHLLEAIKLSNEGHRGKSEAPESKPEVGEPGRQRDPNTGRFLPTKAEIQAAKDAGENVDTSEEVPTTPEVKPPTTSAKLRLGDREFDTPDQAAEYVKNTEWHFGRATESANAWKAEAERLKAALEGKTSTPQTPVQASPNPAGIDEETAQAVWEEAIKAERPDLFMRWVAEEQAKQYEAKLEALKKELQAPVQQQAEQSQLQTAVIEGWNSLDQYTLADGSKAFPEIHDPKASEEIGQHWLALGLEPKDMIKPQAMVAAIATYRMFKQSTQPKQVPQAVPPLPSDARNVMGGVEPPTAISRGDETLSPEVRRLVNGLNAAKSVRSGSGSNSFDLGFSR